MLKINIRRSFISSPAQRFSSGSLRPYALALIGVMIFSATLPLTKISLIEVSPLFVFAARTMIASILALVWLQFNKSVFEKSKPIRKDIIVSMLGTVIGFPLLTTLALKYTDANHGALVIALVPIMTAALSSFIFKSQRSSLFWFFAIAGTLTVLVTVVIQNQIVWSYADTLLFLSATSVSIGYVYGTKAAKVIGGISTISLSLICSLPIVFPVFIFSMPEQTIGFKTILALGYLGIFSMFLGFVFWFKGLSEGEAERVSLVQMLQLFMTFGLSYLFLDEVIATPMIISAVITTIFLAGTKVSK